MKIDFEIINHISMLKIEDFNSLFDAVNDLKFESYIAIRYSIIGEIKALFDIAELLTGYVSVSYTHLTLPTILLV